MEKLKSFEEYVKEQQLQEGIFNTLGNAAGNFAGKAINMAGNMAGRAADATARGVGAGIQNMGRGINRMGSDLSGPFQKAQYDFKNFQKFLSTVTDPKIKQFLSGDVLTKISNYVTKLTRQQQQQQP
jgi:hypothetical protein